MASREPAAHLHPAPASHGNVSSRRAAEGGTGFTGELVVDYPAVPRTNRRRRGMGGIGVFFTAVMAQIFVLGSLAGLAVAFPGETLQLVAKARLHFAPALSAPAVFGERGSSAAVPTDGRLEILRLEDRAIWRRDREAWEALRSKVAQLPVSHPDNEAVHASLIRIQMVYERPTVAEPPALDPREIFPTAATEADIPVASLIQVLHDGQQSETKRQRCAFLLQRQTSPAARGALFQSIQEDRSLLVVRQAFDSFRMLTGYPGRNCFDADEVARWWSRNAHTALGQK